MDASDVLLSLEGQDVYLRTDPQNLDFTDQNKPARLLISSEQDRIEVPLPHDSINALPILLNESIIIGWDIKSLFSYYLSQGINLEFEKPIWDLRIIENFFGIDNPAPTTLREARARLVALGKMPGWKIFSPIYRQVYLPLLTKVYPGIETVGLPHKTRKRLLYSHYEIEGQLNGRSRCSRVLKYSYMPHTLSEVDKNNIAPGDFNVFMCFDYKHMEVSVLQWLSKDTELGRALKSRDVYAEIWEALVEESDPSRAKEMGKNLFLPVVFGLGVKSLAKKLEIREEIARMLINRLYKTFPVALEWVRRQVLDDDNYATDYFGRRRKFEIGSEYKVRNFVIQAPANIICLRKLVNLFESLKEYASIAKVIAHVHDGFYLVVNEQHCKKIFNVCKTVLEAEDELFPNLHLTAACMAGANLNNLKAIRR